MGWDSNPRYAFDVYALSRRAPSTARPPILWESFLDKHPISETGLYLYALRPLPLSSPSPGAFLRVGNAMLDWSSSGSGIVAGPCQMKLHVRESPKGERAGLKRYAQSEGPRLLPSSGTAKRKETTVRRGLSVFRLPRPPRAKCLEWGPAGNTGRCRPGDIPVGALPCGASDNCYFIATYCGGRLLRQSKVNKRQNRALDQRRLTHQSASSTSPCRAKAAKSHSEAAFSAAQNPSALPV